ncbi:hypothetical protein CDAR_184331 [Caerostris darwini]|uniref:Uncharacterized protein n=1 Tax=Caerostris darwini TaxID=1538125 RepID=A0AAV4UG00_9ARAC|nr:hypothetical protein CDAR_184331 [Caerostris darwini]
MILKVKYVSGFPKPLRGCQWFTSSTVSLSCDFSCTKEHVAGVSRFTSQGFSPDFTLDKICILWQKRVRTRSVESPGLRGKLYPDLKNDR